MIQPKCFTQELSSMLKHSDCPVNSTLMWAKCTQQTDSVSIFFLLVENIKKKTHSVWEYNGGDSTMSVGPALHRPKSCGMNATGWVYMLHVLSHGLSLNCSSSSVEVEPVSHRFLKSQLSDQKSHCHLLKNKKKRMSNWYLLLKRKCKTKNEERDKIDKNSFIPEYACQNLYSWIAHYLHTSSV